ncbi:MAG: rhodanese-like domain-containing protein [Burkholderiales bacterium]
MSVDSPTLRQWLGDGNEIALVDVRDGGPFSRSHLLLASNLPLSSLEVSAPALLPRRDARIVLMDDEAADGIGLVERAAALLAAHGYSNLSILRGGVSGWGAASFELFSGTNVPSKAFGEYIEHQCDTPRIDAQTLAAWQAEGRDIVLVDSRPLEEYRIVSLPGAADCPGAELVMRVPGMVHSPTTTVVVNCAGRTRSIIGTQSLRNAGLTNPVVALKNGTMGWELAGFKAERGRDNMAPEPQGDALLAAQHLAQDVAQRYGVRFIDTAVLRAMQTETARTTYAFDVRQPPEFAAGHLPGSLNAPGGQLVQTTDTYAAVRGARIVLIDRHHVQAVMTAHWLLQMGWKDVFVLRDGLSGELESGPSRPAALGESALCVPPIDAKTLSDALASGDAVAIDVGESFAYRRARIPGSFYAMRSHLAQALAGFATDTRLVFVCGDGHLSRFAAADAIAIGYANTTVLNGGRAAWRAAALATETCHGDDDPKLLTATDDMWYPPYARSSKVEEAMQQYLTWEVNLLAQLEREPYLRFG